MKHKQLSHEQIQAFCGALAHLTHAGIGLSDAFMLLKEGETDKDLAQMLSQMARQADDGASLAQIVEQSGRFPEYVSSLLTVGQQVGKQEQTLTVLAQYYDNRAKLGRQLRNALLYPAALLLVLLVVVVVLLVWVLPVFDGVYAQLGGEMTGLAKGFLLFGQLLRRLLPLLCVLVAVAGVACAVAPVRRSFVRLWRQLLGDRGVHRKVLSARFVQALSMALSSGMLIQDALELASSLTKGENAAFERRCKACIQAVNGGMSLPQALQDNGFLRPAERRLLDAGRRSGKLNAVMQQLANGMAEESQDAVAQQMGRIEPAIVAAACLLIGGVLITVMLPLVQILTGIG